jgi:hypothetical protein
MGRGCSTNGEKRDAYKILVGKPEGSGRPRRRWEDNIRMDLREIRWGGMDWIHLARSSLSNILQLLYSSHESDNRGKE